MKARACGTLLLVTALSVSYAQSLDSKPKELHGVRQLALSPDGNRLAFVYKADVWVCDANGGRAIPLTSHIELDESPVWSPDGRWIAFCSNRTGNRDIYLVPSDAGQTQRLTYFSGSDLATDWTPDGKGLLEAGTFDKPENALVTVDATTGDLKEIIRDFGAMGSAVYSADGKSIVYARLGFPWYRPRYQGSAAAQLWKVDLVTGKRTMLRDNGYQHLWPQTGPKGTVFAVTVTEKTPSTTKLGAALAPWSDNAARTPNVYRIDGPTKAERLTNVVGEPVRFLTVSKQTGAWAYVWQGHAWVAQPGQAPKQIEITASEDERTTNTERLILTSGATDAAIDSKNELAAFTVRGEIWTVPIKKGKGPNANDATQVTDFEGLDEAVLWHPSERILFFQSERSGSAQLYAYDPAKRTTAAITRGSNDITEVEITPDGKSLSYWQTGQSGGLYTVSLAGGEPKRVFSQPGEFPAWAALKYAWSPDGRYVAYRRVVQSVANIWLYDTKKATNTNLTELSAEVGVPQFSSDGTRLYFTSDRAGDAIYLLPLQPDEMRPIEQLLAYEKPKTTPSVEFDLNGLSRRIRRFIAQPGVSQMWMDPEKGQLYYVAGGDLYRADYDGDNANRIVPGVGGFEVAADNNALTFMRDGQPAVLDIRKPNLPVQIVAFRADWTRDLAKERVAAMDQVWRIYNRSFYDPRFHGRDWTALRERYKPYLESVGHRNEMANVLNMMIGELESSHSEVGPAAGNPRSQSTASLGIQFDLSYSGPGIKVLQVPEGTPGSFPKTKLNPGDIITQVNSVPVTAGQSLFKVLNEQAGREVTLQVQTGEVSRTVRFRALSGGEVSDLIYQNRIAARRAYVENRSGGKLTYVHIAGMGGNNFATFNREIWQYAQDKKGVIIDVRNNGGGNISDRLIDIIERVPHSTYQDRDGVPTPAPDRAWDLPTVVMHAQSSFSNAEMFPYAMRQRRLATLVGMPTPGYVIWTYELTLVDGTSARLPTAGVYRLDGTPLENNGQQPDIQVELSVDEYLAGRDNQLDAAIDALLKKVK
ncbi:MAG: PD40 domain-containing protein [Chthonomonas sp.]|nr:PD40 domain-containing protein [Chthonomonas sp.]